MELNLRAYGTTIAEVVIKSQSTTIIEDVCECNKGNWEIPDITIEKFITIANEMSRHNEQSDLDFVKKIADSFLSSSEMGELYEWVKSKNTNF
jgi:hypothetical protein